MKKIVKPVIVVEGTSDVNKLSLLVDADFVITKEIAMEYMKKRYPGYHMRPSRWKDIKISVYI
jgi:hypothetical protein